MEQIENITYLPATIPNVLFNFSWFPVVKCLANNIQPEKHSRSYQQTLYF